MTEKKYTEKDMEEYLYHRYSHPYEWVFLTQVRSSTGGADRIADAMAFNMYQSTGFEILGFEIKVTRSDWLSELKNMGKSNELMEYCDKWFLVVPDADIVKEGELPKGWGLLVLKGEKLVMKNRATLQATKPIPDHFLASIMRRNANVLEGIKKSHVHRDEIKEDIRKAEERGYERGQGFNAKKTAERNIELQEKIDLFEEATGVPLNDWKGKDYIKTVGAYVKTALSMDDYTLRNTIQTMESGIKALEKGIKEIKTIKKSL